MSKLITLNRRVLGSVFFQAGLATCFAIASGTATAQDNQDGADATMDEVVVVGTRRSLAIALDMKRNADTMVDAISASDIGKMPDQDIGDSLQRVTGVQIQRSRNGVASDVSIRGLPSSFTRVLYNGNVVNSAFGKSRSFAFETFPAGFVSAIEVHKSPTADLLEGGLSGTVNVRSQRAFDIGERAIVLSARASLEGNSGEYEPDITAIYSNIFADDTVGFTIGYNQFKSVIGQQEIGTNPLTTGVSEAGAGIDYNGDGDTEDTIQWSRWARFLNFNDTRERTAVFSNLEFRPNDNLTIFGEVYHNQYDTALNRTILLMDMRSQAPVAGSTVINHNGIDYFTDYEATGLNTLTQNNPGTYESDMTVIDLEAEYSAGPWTIRAAFNQSDSHLEQYWTNMTTSGPQVDISVDSVSGETTTITYADFAAASAALMDPNNYSNKQLSRSDFGLEFDANATVLSVDIERELDLEWADSVEFGVYYSEDELLGVRQRLSMNNAQLLAYSADGYPLGSTPPGRGGWFDGDRGHAGPIPEWLAGSIGWFTSQSRSALAAAGTLNPEGVPEDVFEDITAAYVRLNFKGAGGALTGNVGVRYVSTDQRSEGIGSDLEAGLIDDGLGGGLSISLPGGDFVSRRYEYNEVLPSLNLRYEINDEHVLRFSASEVMSRAQKSNLQVSANYDHISQTINTDDPNLEPFRGTSFDLSYEWYFAEESLFSIAFFKKDLESLIENVEIPNVPFNVTNTLTGETYVLELTQTGASNSDRGADLSGYELIYQRPFTFLPGAWSNMGTQLNYTYIDNSNPEALVAASEDNYNIVLYYTDEKWDARLAYSYRSDYLQNPAISVLPAKYVSGLGFMVGSLSYQITDNIEANFAVSNITDEGWSTEYEHGHIDRYSDYGRRFTFGVTARF